MSAAMKTKVCPDEKALATISSFDQNPASGGTPASAREPMMNVAYVIGMNLRRPPISNMSLLCTAWITEPEPRKSRALKKACVQRWKTPAAGGADGQARHHVAELGDGRVREHLLDVALDDGHQRRRAAS